MKVDPADIMAPRDGDIPADTWFLVRLYAAMKF